MALDAVRESPSAPTPNLARPSPVRVVTVTGGKGGVGKTSIAINLGLALIERGKQVMLLDADLGLANVDVMLGITARRNISHVLSGECGLADVVADGPLGLSVIPSSSGLAHMTRLGLTEQAGLIHAFSELDEVPDILLVDTAAGLGDSVCNFCVAAQEVLVVVSADPGSITDAYALIKVLSREHGLSRFHVVTNFSANALEGQKVFNQLAMVAERYLQVSLNYAGCIPRDIRLDAGVRSQRPVMQSAPSSASSRAFGRLAALVDGWPWSDVAAGNRLEFFVERVLQSRQRFSGLAS